MALATCTMLLWGMLPLALEALLRWLDPATLIAFRFAVSAAGVFVLLALRGALPPLRRLGRADRGLLLVATLFLGLNYLGYLVGLDWTDAASAQVMIQLAPLLLALGGITVFRESFERLQWLGFFVLLGGLALFFLSQLRALVADADRYVAGAGMIGFAAVTWAIYGLAQKQLLVRLSSQQIMLCIFAGCALLFAGASSPSQLATLDAAGWGLLAFASLNTLVAYGAFAAALEHWEASRVSAVLALTPLATLAFGALAGAIWPGAVPIASLSPRALAGAGLVVAGSMGVALGARRPVVPRDPEHRPGSDRGSVAAR